MRQLPVTATPPIKATGGPDMNERFAQLLTAVEEALERVNYDLDHSDDPDLNEETFAEMVEDASLALAAAFHAWRDNT